MGMEWFRWYHGTTEDKKLETVAKKAGRPRSEVVSVWAALLEEASQATIRGNIAGADPEDIATGLDMETENVVAIIKAMKDKGMIEAGEIANWDKRQLKRDRYDPNSTARSQRHRAKKKSEENTTPWDGAGHHATPRDALDKIREDNTPLNPPKSFPKVLAFKGKVIRLDHRDFHAWSTKYNTEPDIKKWLRERDEWLSTLKKNDDRRKNWLMSTNGDLHRRHRERTIGTPVRPVSPI